MDLNSIYQSLVPSNARFFMESALGNRAPITEKDFSPEELSSLRDLYNKKNSYNSEQEQRLSKPLSEAEYLKNPEDFLEPTSTGGGRMRKRTYQEYLGNLAAQKESYDKTRGKTSISYFDYPAGSEFGAPTGNSTLEAIRRSYTDPSYRLKTTLGSFNAYDQGPNINVQDTYKFDNRGFYNLPKEAGLMDIFKRATGPVSLGDMLMMHYMPEMKRPVNITIPK